MLAALTEQESEYCGGVSTAIVPNGSATDASTSSPKGAMWPEVPDGTVPWLAGRPNPREEMNCVLFRALNGLLMVLPQFS